MNNINTDAHQDTAARLDAELTAVADTLDGIDRYDLFYLLTETVTYRGDRGEFNRDRAEKMFSPRFASIHDDLVEHIISIFKSEDAAAHAYRALRYGDNDYHAHLQHIDTARFN